MLAGWPPRWEAVQVPPDCAPLLPPEQRESCVSARQHLASLKAAVRAGRNDPIWIREAAELALSAQRAAEVLRKKGLAELMPDPAERPPASPATAPSGRAAPPPSAPSGRANPQGHDHHDHEHDRKLDNPALNAIMAYSRVSGLALRQLATFLEHGPRPVRERALAEVARLGGEQPQWARLEALAKEARLTESDPALKSGLDKLVTSLSNAGR